MQDCDCQMARIYFNCPKFLQWGQFPPRAPQVIAAVLCFAFLVGLIILALELLFFPLYNGGPSSVKPRPVDDIGVVTAGLITLGPDAHYGIVMDCGSSGTRVYVYFWPPHSGNPRDLLNIQQLRDKNGNPVVKKVTPGLDTFEENPGAASDYIKPLLKYAASYIPQSSHRGTLLYILATAGMRMIPESAQKAILDDLQTDIPKDFDFIIAENNFEVISGRQEGVYAWIAVNYVLQKFSHGAEEHPLVAVDIVGDAARKPHIRRRTVGMIDMGGGSVQIAYEITTKAESIPKSLLAEFNLGCQNGDLAHTYRVYVTTFLGNGANVARERYEEKLVKNVTMAPQRNHSFSLSSLPIPDPCLPVGLVHQSPDEYGEIHAFKGIGDFKACQALLEPLLNLSAPCEMRPCSLNGVHQPEINYHNSEFYGFSEYWYTMEDVFRMGGLYDPEKFEAKAKDFCGTKWSTLFSWYEKKLYPNADEARFRLQCFKSAWISTFLHKGLKFPQNYRSFTSVQQISNKDVQWTLGALIHRTRFLPLRDIEKLESQHFKPSEKSTLNLYTNHLIIVCFIIVLTAILLYIKRLRLCAKRRTDLRSVPSMSYFMTEADQAEDGLIHSSGYTFS